MAVTTRSDRTSLLRYASPHLGGALPHPLAPGISNSERAAWVGLFNRSLISSPIDNYRAAWIGLGLESIHIYPDPDATLTFADRAQFLNLQRNIDTGGVITELTGVESVASVGAPIVAIGINAEITGVSGAVSVGTLTTIGGAVVTPESSHAMWSVGSLESITTGASLWFNGSWFNTEWFNSEWFNTESGVEISFEAVSFSGSVGDLTVTGESVVNLSGVESQIEVGGLSVTAGTSVSVGVSGVSSIAGIGDLTATGQAVADINGVVALCELGSFDVFDVSNILESAVVSAETGEINIFGSAIIDIYGVGASFNVGDFIVTEIITPDITPDEKHRINIKGKNKTILVKSRNAILT